MHWTILGFHILISLSLAASKDRLGRSAFYLAALPSLATLAWATNYLVAGQDPITSELNWVAGLNLKFSFLTTSFTALMTLIVAGIGVCVFVYSAGYFTKSLKDSGRFLSTLVLFSASMLGLVWADSVWTLFIFWEFTSVTSFLLISHKNSDPAALTAARRALVITAAGGLCLLAGLLILDDLSGSASISQMPVIGGQLENLAAVLIILAAATKSAQVPFHIWLPGAMKAPTPVSAYLHSATMVKAGIVLIALTSSSFVDVPVWKYLGLSFGIASMLWGAIVALRQFDAKLILAWGTISQLGFIVTLFSLNLPKATFAAVAIFLSHAIFKAALFMVVGEIDIRTGTRDIRKLSGLRKSMSPAFFVAVASGLSMAGLPPLIGFAAKEAAIEATLLLSGTEALVVGGSIILGSTLTVAYTTRFLFGVFSEKPDATTEVSSSKLAMTLPAVFLGIASVLGYAFLSDVSGYVAKAATDVNAEAGVYQLLRWPGLTTALYISCAIVLSGFGLGAVLYRKVATEAEPVGAQITDNLINWTLATASTITGRMQHGSLPIYVVAMALTASAAAIPFSFGFDFSAVYLYDNWVQGVLALLIVAASLAMATINSRLGAALALGFVGFGISGLFVVHGAPDLALTQLLVETVIVVGFVIGLGQLAKGFPVTESVWRGVRILVSAIVGLAVAIALIATSANPTGEPPVDSILADSVTVGGGNNVVNVILTDMRALDTLGEVVVLLVVAIGVLALAKSPKPTATRKTREGATQ